MQAGGGGQPTTYRQGVPSTEGGRINTGQTAESSTSEPSCKSVGFKSFLVGKCTKTFEAKKGNKIGSEHELSPGVKISISLRNTLAGMFGRFRERHTGIVIKKKKKKRNKTQAEIKQGHVEMTVSQFETLEINNVNGTKNFINHLNNRLDTKNQ